MIDSLDTREVLFIMYGTLDIVEMVFETLLLFYVFAVNEYGSVAEGYLVYSEYRAIQHFASAALHVLSTQVPQTPLITSVSFDLVKGEFGSKVVISKKFCCGSDGFTVDIFGKTAVWIIQCFTG
jgi:hypothetical protein